MRPIVIGKKYIWQLQNDATNVKHIQPPRSPLQKKTHITKKKKKKETKSKKKKKVNKKIVNKGMR